MTIKIQYGYLYMTIKDTFSSFTKTNQPGICFPDQPFVNLNSYTKLVLQGNYNTEYSFIELYDNCYHVLYDTHNKCNEIHRWRYQSRNNGIAKFLKINPHIKYDSWEDIQTMRNEYNYDNDFIADYYDRLRNMGVNGIGDINNIEPDSGSGNTAIGYSTSFMPKLNSWNQLDSNAAVININKRATGKNSFA
jgi:hypothetical protein